MVNIGRDRPLEVEVFPASEARRVLIIAPAMGVSQRFYSKIAGYFNSLSYTVITFDYYGMLHKKELQHDQTITLENFGKIDIQNVIEFASYTFPGQPVFFLGHSIAGQVLPLAESSNKISAAFLVASQNVSVAHWHGGHRLLVNFFWYITIPFCVRILNRLPGFAFGGKHSLHEQIALDWARLAKTKNGLAGNSPDARLAYENIKVPTYFVSLEGDNLLAPRKAVVALKDNYGSASKEHEHIGRSSNGNEIGHFDFFKEKNKALWPKVNAWFERHIRTERIIREETNTNM